MFLDSKISVKKLFVFFILMVGLGKVSLACDEKLDKDWEFIKEKDQVKIFKKKMEGSKLYGFAGCGEFPVDLKSLVYTLRETDLAIEWVPKLVERKLFAGATGTFGKTYNRFDLGFFLSQRDLVAEHKLQLDGDYLVVDSKSIIDSIGPNEGNVIRMDMSLNKIYFKSVSKDRTLILFLSHGDPKGALPAFIVNWIRTSFPADYINGLVKTAKSYKPKSSFPEIESLISAYNKGNNAL